jgi:transposase
MIGPRQNPAGMRVWIATAPVDMRRSFDSLAEVVRSFLGHDPLSGDLFVFRSKTSERLKILWRDRGGWIIFYKRLDRGTFRFPTGQDRAVAVDQAQLLRLLDGMEFVARRTG